MPHPERGSLEVALFALLFLAFLQLLTEFVASTYALGLRHTRVPLDIIALVLLLSPAVWLVPERVTQRALVVIGELMVLCRLASLALDTRGRMVATGLGTGLFLLFFVGVAWHFGQARVRGAGQRFSAALALAVLLHLLLRSLYAGNEPTIFPPGLPVGAALAILTGWLLWLWTRQTGAIWQPTGADWDKPPGAKASGLRTSGLSVGVIGVFVVLHAGLATPTVTARWTDADYRWLTTAVAGATACFLVLWSWVPGFRRQIRGGQLWGWNLGFLAAWGWAVWSGRVGFPSDPAAYPFLQPPVAPLGGVALTAAMALSPVLYVNLAWYLEVLLSGRLPLRTLAAGYTVAALVLLLLVCGQVFTTVYDYVPGIGPWFRDRFWQVILAAAAVAILPAFLLSPRVSETDEAGVLPGGAFAVGLGLLLALGSSAAVWYTRPQLASRPAHPEIRVMTFNVQQGYDAAGRRDFAGQLAFIRRVNPDILGLQETDTARVAGGNSDLVRYLAERLQYHAVGGPRTGAGTFGIALLSRYPIGQCRTWYLHSRGEQVAVIEAEVEIAGAGWRVFVTHLGNGGPLEQQREVLELTSRATNVVLMGDFNFRPNQDSYRVTTEGLVDAWLAALEKRVDPPTQNLERRIDHVFVSRGTAVSRATFLDPRVSDHPALVVELEPGVR